VPGKSAQAILREIIADPSPLPAAKVIGPPTSFHVALESSTTGAAQTLTEKYSPVLDSIRQSYWPTEPKRRDVEYLQITLNTSPEKHPASPFRYDFEDLQFDLGSARFRAQNWAAGEKAAGALLRDGRARLILGAGTSDWLADRLALLRAAHLDLRLPWVRIENPSALKDAVKQALTSAPLGYQEADRIRVNQLLRDIDDHARFHGANNRATRNLTTVSAEDLMQLRDKSLPAFLEVLPLESKRGKQLAYLPGLVKPERMFFPAKPVVYHAIKGVWVLEAGEFQGFRVSLSGDAGYGLYADISPGSVTHYTRGEGFVLPFRLKNHENVRGLYWDSFARSREFHQISAEARKAGKDIHAFLAREYGIDIIRRTSRRTGGEEYLILNAEALEPVDHRQVLEIAKMGTKTGDAANRRAWRDSSKRWEALRTAAGYPDPSSPPGCDSAVRGILRSALPPPP
jgi:hypothetical protein